MKAAFSKAEIELEIASRFSTAFQPHEKRPSEVIPTGIAEIDSFALGGLPRGAITEVFGPASSGRTSFMLSALTHATNNEEICALVDTTNSFDPNSATRAGMNCERLLWIRCDHNLEHAFKATDLLLQGGGFGLVLLDVPGRIARLLLDLSAESGTDKIEKALTHQTIAQMIGASRETVSRAMKDFQDAGWISVERRRITLADRPALEQRAQVRM